MIFCSMENQSIRLAAIARQRREVQRKKSFSQVGVHFMRER